MVQKPLEIVILGVFSKLMSIDYYANSSFRRLSTISSSSCRTFGVQEEKSSAIPMPIWLIYVPLILPSAVNHRVVLCVNLSYIQKIMSTTMSIVPRRLWSNATTCRYRIVYRCFYYRPAKYH